MIGEDYIFDVAETNDYIEQKGSGDGNALPKSATFYTPNPTVAYPRYTAVLTASTISDVGTPFSLTDEYTIDELIGKENAGGNPAPGVNGHYELIHFEDDTITNPNNYKGDLLVLSTLFDDESSVAKSIDGGGTGLFPVSLDMWGTLAQLSNDDVSGQFALLKFSATSDNDDLTTLDDFITNNTELRVVAYDAWELCTFIDQTVVSIGKEKSLVSITLKTNPIDNYRI